MQQQATFDFPTPPLASVEKTMPHDGRVRELYLSGKSIRETAEALGLGRGAVALAVTRMGISRSEAQCSNGAIDWDKAVALYKAGNGTKYIAKACGTTNHTSIMEGLIKRGVYQANRATPMGNETWAGYVDAEIRAFRRIESAYARWMRSAYKPSVEERNRKAMEYYYRNHTGNKKKAGKRARNRYWIYEKQDQRSQAVRALRRILAAIGRNVSHRRRKRKEDILGCSYDEARTYLAAQFEPGWNWHNYGKEWEIDHVVPLAAFDLLDPNQLRMAAHWSNLRPLSPKLNRSLGGRARKARKSLIMGTLCSQNTGQGISVRH